MIKKLRNPAILLRFISIGIITAVFFSFLLYFAFSINALNYFGNIPTFCPFKRLTGLNCPGCGMTHAFIGISHLDFRSAIKFNLFSLPLFTIILIYAVKGKSIKFLEKNWISGPILGIILITWLIDLFA